MATLRLVIDLTYDADVMHGGDADPGARESFYDVLCNRVLTEPGRPSAEPLLLHSNELGDTVGEVRVVRIESQDGAVLRPKRPQEGPAGPRRRPLAVDLPLPLPSAPGKA